MLTLLKLFLKLDLETDVRSLRMCGLLKSCPAEVRVIMMMETWEAGNFSYFWQSIVSRG